MRLDQTIALVTGGTGGIGSAICRRFAEEGAHVIVSDIDEQAGQHCAATLRDDGLRAEFFRLDVASEADVTGAFAQIADRHDGLDILVNNAMCSTEQVAANQWDPIMGVGLKGTALCSEAAVPLMRRRGGGAIVNVSSVNALGGFANLHIYSAAKAGVIGYTRSLAVALAGVGIRVNAICPGTIETPAWDSFKRRDAGLIERIASKYPGGRIGQPRDVANAALYLASSEAAFVTGAVLVVDGGLTAGLPGFLD